jgi:2-keto-4-pentenoate hydratase/2-oxohepta-3-ene-1,7-dioic acid hydratase in catechol pathway
LKLLRFGPPSREKPGILDAEGRIRDLSKVVPDIAGDVLTPKGLSRIRKARVDKLPLVRGSPRLGACVGAVGNFIGIGLNYADHAAEAGAPVPTEPVVFNKALSSICGPNDDTMIPKGSTKLDYEVEFGIVIGETARYLAKKDAMAAVAGYCVCNDISERAFQREHGETICKGKGAETFGPLGPWLVSKDEIKDPQRLAMWLSVNGEPRQNGNTRTMVFGVAHLVWYLSQFFVLRPGDVIATGTPPGVALGMKPTPVWLKAGDVVRLGIEGLGEQQQKIVRFRR